MTTHYPGNESPQPEPVARECQGADFSKLLAHLAENLEAHADRDGLTGVRRAVFLDRGWHAPGERCPTEPPSEPAHVTWCEWPDDECVCPGGPDVRNAR
jgi:hypothetical protein